MMLKNKIQFQTSRSRKASLRCLGGAGPPRRLPASRSGPRSGQPPVLIESTGPAPPGWPAVRLCPMPVLAGLAKPGLGGRIVSAAQPVRRADCCLPMGGSLISAQTPTCCKLSTEGADTRSELTSCPHVRAEARRRRPQQPGVARAGGVVCAPPLHNGGCARSPWRRRRRHVPLGAAGRGAAWRLTRTTVSARKRRRRP